MSKYFGTVKCICERCDCRSECEYFDSTVYPIISRVCNPYLCDSFTEKIIDVLEDFTCEYFED